MTRFRRQIGGLLGAIALVLVAASCGRGDDAPKAANAPDDGEFLRVVCMGEAAEVKQLLDRGANVNCTQSEGMSALHYAAQRGKPEVVEALLKAGAAVNASDKEGRTPLHLAVRNHAGTETIKKLLDAGANINAKDAGGGTALLAALSGRSGGMRTPQVDQLAAAGADVNAADKGKITPLHMAAGRGLADALAVLIKAKAKLEAKDEDGETPLHWAANMGWDDCVRKLIAAKADMNAKADDGKTAIAMAAYSGYARTVRLLREKGADESSWTRLHWAVVTDRPKAAATRIAAGDDVNAVDAYGVTPLIWAAVMDDEPTATKLLAAKSNVTVADKLAMTALHAAARNGSEKIVAKLLAAKAAVDVRDGDGWTPLHFAARGGHAAVVAQLLAIKAAVNVADEDGWTPLHISVWACRKAWGEQREACEKTLKLLLEAGADPLAYTKEGSKPSDLVNFGTAKDLLEAAEAKATYAKIDQILAAEKGQAGKVVVNHPRDVVWKMCLALYEQDRKSYDNCFAGSPDDRKLVNALYEITATTLDFRKALIAAHGKEGWLRFQSPKSQGSGKANPSMRFLLPLVDRQRLKHIPFRWELDVATCDSIPGLHGIRSLRFVKQKGTWRMDAKSMGLSPAKVQHVCKFFRRFSKTLREAASEVGKPGVTPETLNKKLAKEMFRQMF